MRQAVESDAGPTKRKRPPRMSRVQRREQLLDVAAQVVAERGVAAVTMEGVAARGGVSKALPYNHFEDADDLLVALRDRELELLAARVDEALDSATGFEQQVEAVVHVSFETVLEHHGILTTLLFALPISPDPSESMTPDEPSRVAHFFESELGVSRPVARVAASIVTMALTGGLVALYRGLADRATVETIFTRIVIAGVEAVAADEKAGRLPS